MDFNYDTQDRLRSHVQGRDNLSIDVLELLAMVVTAWAFTVKAKAAPQYAGESILMWGDNVSAVHWVNRCQGGREPRAGALMRILGCLEMHSGWCFRAKHVRCVALRMFWPTGYHGGIVPPSPPTSSRSVRHRLAGAAPGGGGGGSLYRHLGFQSVGGSVASSTRRTYESGRRSWSTFRRLMGCQDFLASSDSEIFKAWD